MTATDATSRSELIIVLKKSNWKLVGEGPLGQMWASPSSNLEVGIPFGLTSSNHEWGGVLDRIAYGQRTSSEELARRINDLRFDVTEFRVDGPLWKHSVPVEAGFNLFKTARQVLRVSATTAKNPKVSIGGGYSVTGDRVLEKARFGQTLEGSYIVPLMVPIVERKDFEDSDGELRQDDPIFEDAKTGHESDERRATRTMAESMWAVYSSIVDRDKPPTSSQVNDLVYAGVSRELLATLSEVVSKPRVTTFDATFRWSELLADLSQNISKKISIPSGAGELLSESAQKFKPKPAPKIETFTGPIVQLRDEEILSHGYVTIETNRNGRQVELQIRVDEENLGDVHEWFKDHETVRVQGSVRRASGHLMIDKPDELTLLRESLLFDSKP